MNGHFNDGRKKLIGSRVRQVKSEQFNYLAEAVQRKHKHRDRFSTSRKLRVAFGLVGLTLSSMAISRGDAANASIQSVGAGSGARLSFGCAWTEPFDSMEVFQGQVNYSFSGEPPEQMLSPKVTRTGSKLTVKGSLAGKAFAAVITNVAFTESEPESEVPYSVSIVGGEGSVNGGKGGCIRYADGTEPRGVTAVADNDVLNVRTKPRATAPLVGSLYNRGQVWVYPKSNTNGWLKVSYFVEATGTKKGRVVDGWVNAKFVANR
jgi:uncharacterized protein YgiM (DUF1202 family)